ncbi:MAG: sigma-70 family RNA polymerase sigma factor [Lachnospiraceae bacterium]|nr:sigma-70 family RNA polymerase sigma factor [Lachnospiraceae bacterium]
MVCNVNEWKDMSDEVLAALAQSDDPEAMDVLMGRYKAYVRKLSHARYLAGGDIDDLIQEGMIGLMKAVRDYEPGKGATFKTFATLCIVRQQTTAVESAGRMKNMPLNQSTSLSAGEWETAMLMMKARSPEDILVGIESSRELLKEIRELLSEFEIKVLNLYLEEMGYREIAEALGKSPKTVDNAIQRIRTKVRGYLNKK